MVPEPQASNDALMDMLKKILVSLALAGLSGCDLAAAPAPAYRPGEAGTVDHALCLLGYTAIPLRVVRTGHHLVEARINAVSGNFVLDTGANVTVVTLGQAKALGIDPANKGVFGLGANIIAPPGAQAQLAGIDSFAIGPIAIRQQRVVLADLGQLLEPLGVAAGAKVAGIIGQDVLTEHRAIIDVERPMLYLMAPDQAPAPVPAERCRAADTAH